MSTDPPETHQDRSLPLTGARWSGVDLLALAFLVVLATVAIWAGPRIGGGIARFDTFAFFIPMYSYLGDSLSSGNIPGWNPYVFAGAPFAGDPESGWMYFPAMVFYLFNSPIVAYVTFALFHVVLAGSTTYLFARILGLGVLGALVAAVAYQYSPILEGPNCCSVRTQVAAWIPLTMIGVELAIRGVSWHRRALWWSVAGLGISQILAGWIGQGAYYGLMLIGAYLAFRTVISPPRAMNLRDRATSLVVNSIGVLGIGFGLAAAGVLPRLDVVSQSTLSGGEYKGVAASAGSSGALQLFRALHNVIAPAEIPSRTYLSCVVFGLALAAPLLARNRALATFFLVTSAGFFVLILKPTPLHELVYLLPGFETLHGHQPSRILVSFIFGPALMAGATVDAIAARHRSSALIAAAAAVPLIAILTIVAYLNRFDREVTDRIVPYVVAVSALLGVAAIVSLRGVRRLRLGGIASGTLIPLILLVLVILEPAGGAIVGVVRAGESVPRVPAYLSGVQCLSPIDGPSPYLREVTAREPVRYFTHDTEVLRRRDNRLYDYLNYLKRREVQELLAGNQSMCLGIQDIQGYNPLQNQRYVDYMAAMNGQPQEYHSSNVLPTGLNSPMLDLLNARYLVVTADVAPGWPDLLHLNQQYRTVYLDEYARILENPHALPRAWIVHEAEQVARGEALNLMTSGSIDLRQTAVLETNPPDLAVPSDPSADSVTVVEYAPDEMTFTVSSDAAGIMMLSEIYDTGWRAYVDGEEVDVLAADHALRAVPLPAGEHTVELRYDPLSLRAGLVISGVTALAMLGTWLVALIRWLAHRQTMPRRRWRLSRASSPVDAAPDALPDALPVQHFR